MATIANDLEDGEIADSGDSETEMISKPGNRPKFDNFSAVFEPRPSRPTIEGQGYRSASKPCANSSEESSSEEEEFNTSPVKAKRGRPNFPLPAHFGNGDSKNEHFIQAASKFQQKHNKQWNDVLLEQTLGESITKVSTVEKDSDEDDQDRGVESYNYKHRSQEEATNDVGGGRDVIDYGDDMFGEGDAEAEMKEEESEKEPDICDIEKFGMEKSQKISARHRLGFKDSGNDKEGPSPSLDDLESFGTGQSQSRKRRIKDRVGNKRGGAGGNGKHVKERLGSRVDYNKPFSCSRKPTFNFSCKETDSAEDVAFALVKALGEPEYQMELFLQVVKTVGVKKCMEVYYLTENIEENGGMLILNGSRRRSAGGVFLQSVKTDTDTTKEMVTAMFPFQNKTKKKRNRQRRTKDRKDNDMETDKMEEKELPSKAEALLCQNKQVTTETPEDDMDLDAKEMDEIQLDFPDD